MQIRIALVAPRTPELQQIRGQLRNPLKFQVREFHSVEELNGGLNTFRFDVLIMRVPQFQSSHVAMVAKARMRFQKIGLVSLASEIDPAARYQAREILRHKLLHETHELADLHGALELLKQASSTNDFATRLRMHPRTNRRDDLEIVDARTGEVSQAQFIDFAQMGAKVQVFSEALFRAGQVVRLRYRSSTDSGKVHVIESRVIWERAGESWMESMVRGPKRTLGIRFVAAL